MGTEDQKTILLVEDEALIAIMEKEILKKHGFDVILASSGEKAIEIVNTNPDIDLRPRSTHKYPKPFIYFPRRTGLFFYWFPF